MPPVVGKGCNKAGAPTRNDLPQHDLTGGNYWMPQAIEYLDDLGKLRLGGGLSAAEKAALAEGASRARHQLDTAAALDLVDGKLRVTNLTGHKLITGYPEGRRMWLRIRWYDWNAQLVREDGAYGPLTHQNGDPVLVANPAGGPPVQVESILELDGPRTRIYEAHYGLTQQWAAKLFSLGYPADLALTYDRLTGDVESTLGDVAAQAPGTDHESFHFVLNDTVIKDNRIPTFGMRYDDARIRNALPVPADQYGDPGPGGSYDYWDEVTLDWPENGRTAAVELLYQPTSWEYIQFLYLANDGLNAFLANEGVNILDAWLNTGMAEPHIMATINVPEPGFGLLMASGIAGLLVIGRQRIRR